MPHNPNTWPDWLELFQSWWRGDTPLGAVIMSIVMAGLRIAYFGGGGGWKRKTLEILLCGALTLTFASALEYVGWPKSLSVAIGGGVGLIGVDAIRGSFRVDCRSDSLTKRKPSLSLFKSAAFHRLHAAKRPFIRI